MYNNLCFILNNIFLEKVHYRPNRRNDARVGEAQRQELQGQDGQGKWLIEFKGLIYFIFIGVVLEKDLQMANLDQVERALRGRARGERGLHVHVVCRRPENSARKPGQQNCRRKSESHFFCSFL